ncbi:MAG: phage tail tape measure protein [Thermoleophilaceae bacterium]
MGVQAGTAYIDFQPDFSSTSKQLGAFFSKRNPKFAKAGKAMAAGIGAAFAGGAVAGKALYDIGEAFDDATDTIRVGTGATGKNLAKLRKDFKAVVEDVPTEFGDASKAIADLNTRLGLTGKPLQKASKQFLELSRITETDVASNVKTVTRAFGDWDVAAGKQTKTLDYFFRASQMSGASVSELTELVVQFGAPLRQVGFTLEESTAMFASFEKAGVNIQTMMPGLKFALKAFLMEGKDPQKALQKTFEGIRDGTIEASEALDIFGQRAGADMVEAVRQGRFDIEKFTRTVARGDDTIMKAGRDTRDFAEQWQMFRNRVMVWLEPMATRVFGKVGDAMERVSGILTDKKLTSEEKFSKVAEMVGDAFERAIPRVTRAAELAAPKVAGAFVDGFMGAGPWGRLLIGGFLLKKLGGLAAFATLGTRIGATAGASAGAAAGTSMAATMRTRMIGAVPAIATGLALAFGPEIDKAMRGSFRGGLPFGDLGYDDEAAEARKDFQILRREIVSGRMSLKDLRREFKEYYTDQEDMPSPLRKDLAKTARSMDVFQGGLSKLRDGTISETGHIAKVSKRNMAIVERALGRGTERGRKLARKNLMATANAFNRHMVKSGDYTQAAKDRIKRIWRRADLVKPTKKMAAELSREWTRGLGKSEKATERSMDRMLREARRMPRDMREVAIKTWMGRLEEMRKAGRLEDDQYRKLRSRVASRFSDIETTVKRKSKAITNAVTRDNERMVDTTARGFNVFRDNMNAALGSFGIKPLEFRLKDFNPRRKQRGGPITEGAPSGDSVPALLERDEYVLNRKAVKRIGRHVLDKVNFGDAPRFQAGGSVGMVRRAYPGLSGDTDFLPQLGFALSKLASATVGNISVTSGGRSFMEQSALWAANPNPRMVARPGTSKHESGLAADTSPQKPAYGGREGAFGLGFPMSWEPWHIELLDAMGGARGAGAALAPKLKRIILEGSDGPLKELGQAALDKVRSAGQRFLNSQTTFAGAGGGPWRGVLDQIAKARGWDAGAWLELVMRESGGNPAAVNPSSGAFGLGQFLGSTRDAYAKFGATSTNGADQIRAMAKYIADRYGNPTAALAFHGANNYYSAGGAAGMSRKERERLARQRPRMLGRGREQERGGDDRRPASVGQRVADSFRTIIGSGKPQRRRKAERKVLRIVKGLGLPEGLQRQLHEMSSSATDAGEFASNASVLNETDEDGNPIVGRFRGKTEADWLNERLSSLMGLRNRLLEAHGKLQAEQDRAKALFDQAKARLAGVAKAIRKDAKVKRRLEGRRKGLHTRLKKLRKHPKRNRSAIKAVRDRLGNLRDRIGNIDDRQAKRVRLRDSLKSKLIPEMRDRRRSLTDLSRDVLGSGTDSFDGLETVQGRGGPMTTDTSTPKLGGPYGGGILDALSALRDINADAEGRDPGGGGTDDTDSELARLYRELFEDERKRRIVADRQFAVLQDIPPVGEQFQRGGKVPGTGFGDKVRALLEPGEVVINKEAVRALGGAERVDAVNQEYPRFQGGGTVPGPKVPELAAVPGGDIQLPDQSAASQPVNVQVIVQDGAVDANKIKTIVGQQLRGATRTAIASGPGRGGGLR